MSGGGGVKKGLFGNKAANDNAKEKTVVTSKRVSEGRGRRASTFWFTFE